MHLILVTTLVMFCAINTTATMEHDWSHIVKDVGSARRAQAAPAAAAAKPARENLKRQGSVKRLGIKLAELIMSQHKIAHEKVDLAKQLLQVSKKEKGGKGVKDLPGDVKKPAPQLSLFTDPKWKGKASDKKGVRRALTSHKDDGVGQARILMDKARRIFSELN